MTRNNNSFTILTSVIMIKYGDVLEGRALRPEHWVSENLQGGLTLLSTYQWNSF